MTLEPDSTGLVARWLAAMNVRDLPGMLACAHPEISFQPLGAEDAEFPYLGHAGVTRWFEEPAGARDRYDLAPERFDVGPDAEVIAVGAARFPHEPDPTPISGVHWLWDDLLIKVEHRYGDYTAVEPVGVASSPGICD